MKFVETGIAGSWVVELPRFADDRGWFQEWFKLSHFTREVGVEFVPVQANISKSRAGTIRGIHYSLAPEGQGKLVTVMSGAIDDYVVDIRDGSPTFGEWRRIRLDETTPAAVLIDPHLGHAFQSVTDETVVSYLVTAEFNPEMELAITPLCKELAVEWSLQRNPVFSTKDISAPSLSERQSNSELPTIGE